MYVISQQIKPRQCVLLCLSLLFFCAELYAENLVISFSNKLSSPIEKNILGHLGKLPNNESERNSFIYSAKENIDNALRALGYYQADINIAVEKDHLEKKWRLALNKDQSAKWQLNLKVELNTPTLINKVNISILGEAKQDPAFSHYLQRQPLKKGQRLNHANYEQVKNELTSIGLERGYFKAHVKNSQLSIQQDFSSADINIIYESGPRYHFGDVHFSEFDIEPALLAKLTPFNKGDYYLSSKLLEMQNQLQQTQYFSSSIALPDRGKLTDNSIPINVTLNKEKSHYFNFGVGYSTDTLFRVSAGWRTPILNRYGHRQETKIEYSQINPQGRFTYSIPLSHPIKDLLQLQLALTNDEYGDIDSTYFDAKVGNLRVMKNWTGQYYLRHLNENWTFNDEKNRSFYLLPGFSLSRTTRSGPALDPSHGFSQLYTIEGGSNTLGSEINVIRTYARWRYITTPIPQHRFVLRGELGASFIDDDEKALLAPSLRFFAGGDQSIRGFAYNSLGSTQEITTGENAGTMAVVGGTRLLVSSIEYQYYWTDKFRSVLFTDGGNALDKLDFKFAYSAGTGAHYISPVGPIRLDVGYSLSEDDPSWRIHFSLGAEL